VVKHAIAPAILLLVGASVASAQETFNATSGSMVIQFMDDTGPFTVAGPEFSASGVVDFSEGNPLDVNPFSAGSHTVTVVADTENPNLTVSLSVHGAPWALPPEPETGVAGVSFTVNTFVLEGPGTYSSTFDFSGEFIGVPLSVFSANPGEDCSKLMCTRLLFDGGGNVTLDAVPDPNFPGAVDISKVTFTFKAPEPSTASLLLIALAGLAVLWRHRRPYAN